MPRKKKTDSDIPLNNVTGAFSDVTMLLKDEMERTVAQLAAEGMVSKDDAVKVTTTLQTIAADCVSRIRASRGF